MSRIAPMNLRSRMGIFRSIAPTPARRYGPRHSCPQWRRSQSHAARAGANFGREWTLANFTGLFGRESPLANSPRGRSAFRATLAPKNAPLPRLAPSSAPRGRAVRLWLLAVAALIFVPVVVGGATRLTESGLSIVEWKPVTGVMPP